MTKRFMVWMLLLGCVAAVTWLLVQNRPKDVDAQPEDAVQSGEVVATESPPTAEVPNQITPEQEAKPVVTSAEIRTDNPTQINAPPVIQAAPTHPIAPSGPFAAVADLPPPDAEIWTYPALMQQNASNNLFRARSKLAAATSEYDRYLSLGEVAKLEFVFGNSGQALINATELLALDARFRNEPWRDGNAVHNGNFVLGRIAAQQGLVEEARQYLLEAGKSTGSPVLGSFGPNMSLARDLLVRGEREAVLTYFDLCRKFWGSGEKQLMEWSEEVKAGRMPDFGANMYY